MGLFHLKAASCASEPQTPGASHDSEWKHSVTCDQAANQTQRDGGQVPHGPRGAQSTPAASSTSTEKIFWGSVRNTRPHTSLDSDTNELSLSFPPGVSTLSSAVQKQGVEVPFSCFLSLCCEDGNGRGSNNRMSLTAAPEGRLPLWDERAAFLRESIKPLNQTLILITTNQTSKSSCWAHVCFRNAFWMIDEFSFHWQIQRPALKHC